jgi:hypothetical protein
MLFAHLLAWNGGTKFPNEGTNMLRPAFWEPRPTSISYVWKFWRFAEITLIEIMIGFEKDGAGIF